MNRNETNNDIEILDDAEIVVTCLYITAYAGASYDYQTAAVSEMKLATASIVGWSNSNVCETSAVNQSVSMLANSVAAIESRPEAMRGAFVATSVPIAPQMIAETASATALTLDESSGSPGQTSWRVMAAGVCLRCADCDSFGYSPLFSVGGVTALLTDRSDGLSKSSAEGSYVPRCLPNHVDSSVDAIESSPADINGMSSEIAVPMSSTAILISSMMRQL